MQEFRNTMMKKQVFQDEVLKYYGPSRILYSNFWLVVLPEQEEYAYKIYFSKTFFQDHNMYAKINPYEQEKYAYNLFWGAGFLLPGHQDIWRQNFWEYDFSVMKFENIRLHNKKIQSFLEIDPWELWAFISKFHSVKEWYIHGNIHPSNIFISWKNIGIFDLASCYYWEKEYDIARVLVNANSNFKYLYSFLESYEHQYDIRRVLYFAIKQIRYVMKIQRDNHEELRSSLAVLLNELRKHGKIGNV